MFAELIYLRIYLIGNYDVIYHGLYKASNFYLSLEKTHNWRTKMKICRKENNDKINYYCLGSANYCATVMYLNKKNKRVFFVFKKNYGVVFLLYICLIQFTSLSLAIFRFCCINDLQLLTLPDNYAMSNLTFSVYQIHLKENT